VEARQQAVPRHQARDNELIAAAGEGDTSRLEQLLKEGANANAANKHGYTALMMAAYYGKVQAMKALVLAGADVNARSQEGETALMRTTAGNKVPAMQYLFSRGLRSMQRVCMAIRP
jgi:ankyrin repeat protein